MKKLNIATTIIDLSVKPESILSRGMPSEIQALIKSADSMQSSGHQEVLGHKGRQLIFEAGGYWEGKKFIVDSIGGILNGEHITWKKGGKVDRVKKISVKEEIKMKKLSIKKESNNIKKTAVKDYPTQYDAEFMVELAMLLQNISTAGTSSFTDAKQMINEVDKKRMDKWDAVFGDSSPWSAVRGGKGLKVKWNKDKAKRLGL